MWKILMSKSANSFSRHHIPNMRTAVPWSDFLTKISVILCVMLMKFREALFLVIVCGNARNERNRFITSLVPI